MVAIALVEDLDVYAPSMETRFAALIVAGTLTSGVSAADEDSLPYDTPTMVEGAEAVCAGIGQDSRIDPPGTHIRSKWFWRVRAVSIWVKRD